MLVSLATTSCLVPLQAEPEPVPENEPPVVDIERTNPYVLDSFPVQTDDLNFSLDVVVADPNEGDTLRVRVVKNLDMTFETGNHTLLASRVELRSADIPDPVNEPTVRSKRIRFDIPPCRSEDENSRVRLDVCITDRDYADEVNPTVDDPCLPTEGGLFDRYYVVIQCVPVQ